MKIDHYTQYDAELARRHHLDFMRFMWQRPDPLIVGRHTEAVCETIDNALSAYKDGKSSFLGIRLPFRHGKAININELVLTPNGKTLHGELRVGDYVFGRDGSPVRVIAVGPLCYADNLITFSDGSKIVAHDRHEWVVVDEKYGYEVTLETSFISDSGCIHRFPLDPNPFCNNGYRYFVSIEKVEPVLANCITVDGGIYLVGETNIPTHNSDIVSRYLPPNFIGKHPDTEVIVAAYTSSLVRTFSRFSRQIVRDPAYRLVYPGINIARDQQAIDEWGIQDHYGVLHWIGIGGSATGKGANLCVIDDFFKNREEAESEVMRNKVWDSITNDILTRLAPVSIVIILATPWHVDDAFGRIDKKMSEDPMFPRFKNIIFPAWSDKYPKYYLFPERFQPEWYMAESAILGPYGTASLLLCDPVLRGGNILKTDRIQYYDGNPPDDVTFSRGWDLASSEKERVSEDPDYTVGTKLGVRWLPTAIKDEYIPQIYIDDAIIGRWEAQERNQIIRDTAIADGHITVGVEAYGPYKDAYTQIAAVLNGLRIVKKIQLPGDKVSKVALIEPAFAAGNVFMRRAPWNAEVIKQLTEFPGGSHDDAPDSIVVAYATHDPHVKKVWPRYSVSHLAKLNINWDSPTPRNALHYAVICQAEDLSLYVLCFMWDDLKGILLLYYAFSMERPDTDLCVARMKNVMHMDKFAVDKILGNYNLFDSESGVRDMSAMFKDSFRKHGIGHLRVNEPVRYDLYGSISIVDTMMSRKLFYADSRLPDVSRQITGWAMDDGRPSEKDWMYCEGICLIASELRRRGSLDRLFVPSKAPLGDYADARQVKAVYDAAKEQFLGGKKEE